MLWEGACSSVKRPVPTQYAIQRKWLYVLVVLEAVIPDRYSGRQPPVTQTSLIQFPKRFRGQFTKCFPVVCRKLRGMTEPEFCCDVCHALLTTIGPT